MQGRVILPLLGFFALGLAEICTRQQTSPGREVLCYTLTNVVESIENNVCQCTTLVHQGYDLMDISASDIQKYREYLKNFNPFLQFVVSINDVHGRIKTSGLARQEAIARIATILNEVDGVELNVTAGSKERLVHFVQGIKEQMTRKSSEKRIFLALPTTAEELAKQFDIKGLSKYVDLFTISTHYLMNKEELYRTFHPSRLMGIFDMLNTDSLVDLVHGLGAEKRKILISLPASGYKFTLKDDNENAPRAFTDKEKPVMISRKEICEEMKEGEWTIERDEDSTAPYAFKNKTWIAFEDETSTGIKGKYVILRDLAGLAIRDIENDVATDCGKRVTEEVYTSFTSNRRKTREAVLSSLQEDIYNSDGSSYPDSVRSSNYRINRVVDTEGQIHAVRENTQTEFSCTSQGYFVHPKSCNRFYRCVKFDQGVDEYSVFEFDCPAGLSFDERTDVCVWPGSLPEGSPCPGSPEIAPSTPRGFRCPGAGYYADPGNCRWFFACMDLGQDGMMSYEFRCPYGLVFDENKLACEWPWLVPNCGDGTNYEKNYGGYDGTLSQGGYQGGRHGGNGGTFQGGYDGNSQSGYDGNSQGSWGGVGNQDGHYIPPQNGWGDGNQGGGGYDGNSQDGWNGGAGQGGWSQGGYDSKNDGGYDGSQGGYDDKNEGSNDGSWDGKNDRGYNDGSQGGYDGSSDGGYDGSNQGENDESFHDTNGGKNHEKGGESSHGGNEGDNEELPHDEHSDKDHGEHPITTEGSWPDDKSKDDNEPKHPDHVEPEPEHPDHLEPEHPDHVEPEREDTTPKVPPRGYLPSTLSHGFTDEFSVHTSTPQPDVSIHTTSGETITHGFHTEEVIKAVTIPQSYKTPGPAYPGTIIYADEGSTPSVYRNNAEETTEQENNKGVTASVETSSISSGNTGSTSFYDDIGEQGTNTASTSGQVYTQNGAIYNANEEGSVTSGLTQTETVSTVSNREGNFVTQSAFIESQPGTSGSVITNGAKTIYDSSAVPQTAVYDNPDISSTTTTSSAELNEGVSSVTPVIVVTGQTGHNKLYPNNAEQINNQFTTGQTGFTQATSVVESGNQYYMNQAGQRTYIPSKISSIKIGENTYYKNQAQKENEEKSSPVGGNLFTAASPTSTIAIGNEYYKNQAGNGEEKVPPISPIREDGYKINEYYDNGGRGTIRYNNGLVSHKFSQNDVRENKNGLQTVGSSGFSKEYQGSQIKEFTPPANLEDVYTKEGFTKTGPTVTGITTAQVGGSGTYVAGAFVRPASESESYIGENAFATNNGTISNLNNAPGGARTISGNSGYQYEKPTTGYHYEKPTTGYHYEKPTTGYHYEKPTTGYHYEKPTTGYHYEKPTSSSGYQYTKPSTPFNTGPPSTSYTTQKPKSNNVIYNSPSTSPAPTVVNTYSYNKPAAIASVDIYPRPFSPQRTQQTGIPTVQPLGYTTSTLEDYQTTLYQAGKVPIGLSTVRPVIDNGYKTVISPTAIPVIVETQPDLNYDINIPVNIPVAVEPAVFREPSVTYHESKLGNSESTKGYNYERPKGYNYEKPKEPFREVEEVTSTQRPPITYIPYKQDTSTGSKVETEGYTYEKPLTTKPSITYIPQTTVPNKVPTHGYNYDKPTQGYNYEKPGKPLNKTPPPTARPPVTYRPYKTTPVSEVSTEGYVYEKPHEGYTDERPDDGSFGEREPFVTGKPPVTYNYETTTQKKIPTTDGYHYERPQGYNYEKPKKPFNEKEVPSTIKPIVVYPHYEYESTTEKKIENDNDDGYVYEKPDEKPDDGSFGEKEVTPTKPSVTYLPNKWGTTNKYETTATSKVETEGYTYEQPHPHEEFHEEVTVTSKPSVTYIPQHKHETTTSRETSTDGYNYDKPQGYTYDKPKKQFHDSIPSTTLRPPVTYHPHETTVSDKHETEGYNYDKPEGYKYEKPGGSFGDKIPQYVERYEEHEVTIKPQVNRRPTTTIAPEPHDDDEPAVTIKIPLHKRPTTVRVTYKPPFQMDDSNDISTQRPVNSKDESGYNYPKPSMKFITTPVPSVSAYSTVRPSDLRANPSISRDKIDRLMTNNRGNTRFSSSEVEQNKDDTIEQNYPPQLQREQVNNIEINSVELNRRPGPSNNNNQRTGFTTQQPAITTYSGNFKKSSTPLVQNASKEIDKPKPLGRIVVKYSDLHPVLLGKLGGECICKTDPFADFRSSNKPLVIDSTKGKIDLRNYDESEVYVDLEASQESNKSSERLGIDEERSSNIENNRPSTSYLPSNKYLPSTTSSPLRVSASDIEASASSEKIAVRAGKSLGPSRKPQKSSSAEDYVYSDEIGVLELTPGGRAECARPGLFRHPKYCNKFYICHWDQWKKKFTLHVFNCPIHLTFDRQAGACNWPTNGPACQDNTLLV